MSSAHSSDFEHELMQTHIIEYLPQMWNEQAYAYASDWSRCNVGLPAYQHSLPSSHKPYNIINNLFYENNT